MNSSSNDTNGTKSTPNVQRKGFLPAMEYIYNHKQETLMWLSRTCCMSFIFLYLFPFFTNNPYSYYYKALMANALTSIVRLHQRIPRVEFTKEFLARLIQEDSCHYLLFSLIFLYTHPATLVLLPVFLFSLLHSASYNLKLLHVVGFQWQPLIQFVTKIVNVHSQSILCLVAFTEIFLMPLSVFMLFIGRGSLLTPIVYYRFLTLRYQSKRNPYTRTVFYELRVAVEMLANQPSIPQVLRNLCYKLIALVSRLAPPIVTAAPASSTTTS